jgi:hypothetical protein
VAKETKQLIGGELYLLIDKTNHGWRLGRYIGKETFATGPCPIFEEQDGNNIYADPKEWEFKRIKTG